MSNTNTPRGFKPVRYVDNRPFSGGENTYRVASGTAVNIFAGDVVKMLSTGYVTKANAGDQMRGVAAGFKWVDTTGTGQFSRFWPSGTVTLNGQDAQILVYDDPGLVFEAAFTNSTGVPAVGNIGANFNLFDAGGSAAAGLSGEGIDFASLTVASAQFNFLEFVQRPDNDPTSAYSRGYFTPKSHDFRVLTGI